MASHDRSDDRCAQGALDAATEIAWERPAACAPRRRRRSAALLVHAIVLETLCGGSAGGPQGHDAE